MFSFFFHFTQAVRLHSGVFMPLRGVYALYSVLIFAIVSLSPFVLLLWYLDVSLISVVCCAPSTEDTDLNITLDSSNESSISAPPSNTPSAPNHGTLNRNTHGIDLTPAVIAAAGLAAAAFVAKTLPTTSEKLAGTGIMLSATVATVAALWIPVPTNPIDLQIALVLCVIAFVFLSILCCVSLIIYIILLQQWIAERLISLFSQKWIPYVRKWVDTYLEAFKVLRWVYFGVLLWCLSFAFWILQYHLDWLLHLPK